MNTIITNDLTGKAASIERHLKEVLQKTARSLKLKNTELSLTLVTDRRMKALNHQYRGKNRSTDVLAFSQDVDVKLPGKLLGDVIIATPTARRQAKEACRPEKDEFAMLAIHGLLHLLGYDHEKPVEAKKMFSLQNRLLKEVQIDI